jgi:uncharacterized protein (TIGR03067 family)
MSVRLLACVGTVLLLCRHIAADNSKKEHDELQGTWKMIYTETEGKGFKPTNDVRNRFEKGIMTELSAGEEVGRFSYKLCPDKNPKVMEIVTLENHLIPESKGHKISWIYEVLGDRLKVCYSFNAGIFTRSLPKEFKTQENDGHHLIIFERVKP